MKIIIAACLCVALILPASQVNSQSVTAKSRAVPANPQPEYLKACYNEFFIQSGGPFTIVRFKDGASPGMIRSDDACLKGGDLSQCTRVPVDPAHTWYAGTPVGEWICITDAESSGWTQLSLVSLMPAPAVPAKAWEGYWADQYESADMTIGLAEDGKTLTVTGNAEWRGGPDSLPNLGNLDGSAVPASNQLELGDPACVRSLWVEGQEEPEECFDCAAVLVLINDRILVQDNHKCGGMNVNFDGIYDRRDPKRRLDIVREP